MNLFQSSPNECKQCANKLIDELKKFIKMIDELIFDIDNSKMNIGKFYKHEPFATNSNNIECVNINNDELHIKYKNIQDIQKIILFNYKEKYRSFSFVANKADHIVNIKTQLSCYKNRLNIIIDSWNKLSLFDYDNDLIKINLMDFKNDVKNLTSIIKLYLREHNCKEYYISVFPRDAFIRVKDYIHIATLCTEI
jgi:hypothetical protein